MRSTSTISDVFSLYDRALSLTKSRLEEQVLSTTDELRVFYDSFFHDQIIQYADRFEKPTVRREIHRHLQQRHKSSTLRFWAVDGACRRLDTSDLVVFYGGAYAVKGRLELQDNPPLIVYEESEPEDDSSIVAYLPLNPEDITILEPEDRFVVSDEERVSLSGIEISLMLLAEVYLLYRGASDAYHPHILIWDHSLSSVLANATPGIKRLHFTGVKIADEVIWYPDLLVGYSKPWNVEMDVPSKKAHRLWERVIAFLYSSPDGTVDLEEIARTTSLRLETVESQTKILWECDRSGVQHENGNPADALVHRNGTLLTLNPIYQHAPEKIERLFNYFCRRFFRDKDPSVLIYTYRDEFDHDRSRYLSPDELSFLLAIGLRLTIESCWTRRIALIGVVKDSASAYFTRHYLGVMRNIGALDFDPKIIPGSDRLTCERLPYIEPGLKGPWATVEFDSVFMTLRMKRDYNAPEATLQGVRGDILVPPNLIMRSLVQFHLDNGSMQEPSMGHVIFVDRLVHPGAVPGRIKVIEGDRDLGTLEPFFFEDGKVQNPEQEIVIYLLSVLTRNVFPEVIGYPDPLHYADRGAKSVLHMVEPMLLSSERLNRINPIHRTLRQNRGG